MWIKTQELKRQRSDFCEYSDAYIIVKGTIATARRNGAKRNKAVTFKIYASFINRISKINEVKIVNAEDLDVVTPVYNLLEYSKNYRKTTGSLWNYYRDEPNNPLSSNFESFKYKTSITENTYKFGSTEEWWDANKVCKSETKVVISLKHLGNFWRSFNTPLINSEVELILTCSKNCVLADMTVNAAANPAIVAPTRLEFKITDTKLYVRGVTLSKEHDIKLLEQLKSGFKRNIKWNKYKSQMNIQSQNNNLNYLINPTFTNRS